MGKRRNKKATITQQEQDRMISKLEDDVRARENTPCVQESPHSGMKSLLISDGVQYKGIERIANFKASALIHSLKDISYENVENASGDLNLNCDIMLQKFTEYCLGDARSCHFYLRSYTNFNNFAILQRCVESLNDVEPQECLQSWIMICGRMFVFGGTAFTLTLSVRVMKEYAVFIEKSKKNVTHGVLKYKSC
jgi:hypothetical protein